MHGACPHATPGKTPAAPTPRVGPQTLTPEAQRAALGKRPLCAWQGVAEAVGLDVPAQQLFDASEPLLSARWGGQRGGASLWPQLI